MSAASSQTPDPKPQTRKSSGVVIPNAPKWHQRLAAWMIWAVFNLISATLRYRITDPHGLMTRPDLGPVIYCIWHNRLALCMKLYLAFGRPRNQSAGLAGLGSGSQDCAVRVAGAARRHCWNCPRGPTAAMTSPSRRTGRAGRVTLWLKER